MAVRYDVQAIFLLDAIARGEGMESTRWFDSM